MAAQIATRSKGPRLTKAQDREHALKRPSRFGMWHADDLALVPATPVTVADALAETRARSAEIGNVLRNVEGGQAPAHRSAARTRAAERVAAAVARAEAKAPAAAPAPARPTYAEVDAMLAKIPVGRYALPRNEATAAGNTVTFFEIYKAANGGHRIVQLVGSVGTFATQTLNIWHQFYAAKHLAADPKKWAVLFGHETNTCGRCGSPLTNEASRKRGLGPKCAQVY